MKPNFLITLLLFFTISQAQGMDDQKEEVPYIFNPAKFILDIYKPEEGAILSKTKERTLKQLNKFSDLYTTYLLMTSHEVYAGDEKYNFSFTQLKKDPLGLASRIFSLLEAPQRWLEKHPEKLKEFIGGCVYFKARDFVFKTFENSPEDFDDLKSLEKITRDSVLQGLEGIVYPVLTQKKVDLKNIDIHGILDSYFKTDFEDTIEEAKESKVSETKK